MDNLIFFCRMKTYQTINQTICDKPNGNLIGKFSVHNILQIKEN